jgi:hypothetical protein
MQLLNDNMTTTTKTTTTSTVKNELVHILNDLNRFLNPLLKNKSSVDIRLNSNDLVNLNQSPSEKMNSQIDKEKIELIIDKNRIKLKKLSNFFPDFYQNYDYDQLYVDEMQPTKDNQTTDQYFGFFSNNNYFNSSYMSDQLNNNSTSSIFSQLYTPLFYIVLLLIIYCFIVFVLFMSALYSHRKRVGYNYDECVDESGIDSEMPDLKRQRNELKVDITNEKTTKLTRRSNDSIYYTSVNDSDCNSDSEIYSEDSNKINNNAEKETENGKRENDKHNSKKVKETERISYLNKLFLLLSNKNNKSYKKFSNHFNKKMLHNRIQVLKSVKSKKREKNSKKQNIDEQNCEMFINSS